jgi:hypothetical protein
MPTNISGILLFGTLSQSIAGVYLLVGQPDLYTRFDHTFGSLGLLCFCRKAVCLTLDSNSVVCVATEDVCCYMYQSVLPRSPLSLPFHCHPLLRFF